VERQQFYFRLAHRCGGLSAALLATRQATENGSPPLTIAMHRAVAAPTAVTAATSPRVTAASSAGRVADNAVSDGYVCLATAGSLARRRRLHTKKSGDWCSPPSVPTRSSSPPAPPWAPPQLAGCRRPPLPPPLHETKRRPGAPASVARSARVAAWRWRRRTVLQPVSGEPVG